MTTEAKTEGPDKPPTFDDLKGINITGNIPPEVYVRYLRGDDLLKMLDNAYAEHAALLACRAALAELVDNMADIHIGRLDYPELVSALSAARLALESKGGEK